MRPRSHPHLTVVPADKLRVERRSKSRSKRRSKRQAEEAALALVRVMGEGDLFERLGKLEVLQVLDNMRCAWLKVVYAGLAETTWQDLVCSVCIAKVCALKLETLRSASTSHLSTARAWPHDPAGIKPWPPLDSRSNETVRGVGKGCRGGTSLLGNHYDCYCLSRVAVYRHFVGGPHYPPLVVQR